MLRDSESEQAKASEVEEEDMNYYKENIFNKEDYYLYRAVMFFYAGDYEKALADFEASSAIMHAQKTLYPKNQFGDSVDGEVKDDASHESSQTDLSDVGLCSLNVHEFSYNTVLCYLMMKDYKKAQAKLDYMFETMPKKYASQLWLVRGLVNQQITGSMGQAKKDFKRAHKYDEESASKFLDQRSSVQLAIFP